MLRIRHTVLLLAALGVARTAAAVGVLRVFLTEEPGSLRLGRDTVSTDDIVARAAATRTAHVAIGLGKGGRLAAVDVARLGSALAEVGAEFSLVPTRLGRGLKPHAAPDLSLAALLETAGSPPDAADITAPFFHGDLLEVDLRALAALREGRLDVDSDELAEGRLPGVPKPGAAVLFAVGPAQRTADLFAALGRLHAAGAHRVVWLLGGEKNGVRTVEVSLDRPDGSVGKRRRGPRVRGAAVWRSADALLQRGLASLADAIDEEGSLPGDGEFSSAEATALGVVAFVRAGVRAGRDSAHARALALLERRLLALPFQDGHRHRRERAVIAAARLLLYNETRHPLLRSACVRTLSRLAEEIEGDEEWRDGVPLGFEAVALLLARRLGLSGAEEPAARLLELAEAAVDENGTFLVVSPDRSSVDGIALAHALVLGGARPDDRRVLTLAEQGRGRLPAVDRRISNPRRALSAFFRALLAESGRGAHEDALVEDLRALLEAPGASEVEVPWPDSEARRALLLAALAVPRRIAERRGGGR